MPEKIEDNPSLTACERILFDLYNSTERAQKDLINALNIDPATYMPLIIALCKHGNIDEAIVLVWEPLKKFIDTPFRDSVSLLTFKALEEKYKELIKLKIETLIAGGNLSKVKKFVKKKQVSDWLDYDRLEKRIEQYNIIGF